MSPLSLIIDPVGPHLSEEEKSFFKDINPWGFILFQRHCQTPDQVRALIDDLKNCVGRDILPILIDEEGGRVQRLKPPHWRPFPCGRVFGDIYDQNHDAGLEAVRLNSKLLGRGLMDLGINVDCLPVLDIPVEGSHEIIGDRAYGLEPAKVAALGKAAAEGLLDAGVLPVIKHMPGHGRANVDTHENLPIVDAPVPELETTDFSPFRDLRDYPLAMTAHVVYAAIDPTQAATTSPTVIDKVIRDQIGFDGLLMTDDLSMKALDGALGERATRALEAGCDAILYCNGTLEEKEELATACIPLAGKSKARADQAIEMLGMKVKKFDPRQDETRISSLFENYGQSYSLA